MSADALFGQGIFEDLQRKIDEDTAVKDVSGDRALQKSNGRADELTSFGRQSVILFPLSRSKVRLHDISTYLEKEP
jgi:hypothetical protein